MCARIVAITGSPGTGKSTLAAQLQQHGFHVLSMETIAQQANALFQHNGLREIDTSKLSEWNWTGEKPCFIDGHLSQYCSIDAAIVLRCNPSVLRDRLSARPGYGPAKIESNVEWELLSGVWTDLVTLHPKAKVLEIDNTSGEIELETILHFVSNLETSASVENSVEDSIDWISI